MEKKATKMMKDIKEKWERTKKEDISSINEKLEVGKRFSLTCVKFLTSFMQSFHECNGFRYWGSRDPRYQKLQVVLP